MAEVDESDAMFTFKPIGRASTWFRVKNATPRQPTVSALTRGSIKISKEIFNNPEHSLENLDQFSHVWILFIFHKNGNNQVTKAKVAPPRLNGQRVGVFSTRTPHRPNPIGLTLAKIEKVEGDTLHLCGVDLLDGTPVVDIKPYIPSYDSPQPDSTIEGESQATTAPVSAHVTASVPVSNPAWTSIGRHQTLTVFFTASALQQVQLFSPDASNPAYRLQYLKSADEAIQAITDILQEDPRSIYRKTKCHDRLYFCIVDSIHVTSWFDEVSNKCEVLRVMPFSTRKAMNEKSKDSEVDEASTTSH